VQLLLWTAGGLFFSLNVTEKVRGVTSASARNLREQLLANRAADRTKHRHPFVV
jgi:hypothetical protein